MEKVYIDNNTLIYIVEGEDRVLQNEIQLLLKKGLFSFVFSLWNLFEAAKSYPKQAETLARYIDSLEALWFMPPPFIQDLEVKNFLYKNHYYENIEPLNPFCRSLSEVFTYLSKDPVEIGTSALSLIREAINHPFAMAEIIKTQSLTPKSLEIIRRKKLEFKKNEREIFNKKISLHLPKRDPKNQLINKNELENILDYCYKNKSKFYKHCPTFFIEDRLIDFRISDPKRISNEQDAIDSQNQLLALTYADHFVTNDGFVVSGNDYVRAQKSGIKMAITHRKIADCLTVISRSEDS